ncbi:hypothetical protein ACFL6I_17105 [candidate division KSB1 bacterium]
MNDSQTILGDNRTRLAIIEILDKYKSLSAKKIHSRLNKEHGISVTYQAAHKAIKKMEEKGILIVAENQFRISPNWVQKMKSFVQQIEKNTSTMEYIFQRLDSGKTYSFTAKTDMEMGYFALDFAHYFNSRHSKEEGPFILNFHFMWTVLPLSHEQFKMLKEIIQKRGVYATAHENSTYDGIMKRHWEKVGAKVEIGVKDFISNCEVVIIGDYVINNFWDPKHLKWNIDFTQTVKDEKSLDYHEFYKVLAAPTKTEIVVIKNKQVAEQLRKKSLRYFK